MRTGRVIQNDDDALVQTLVRPENHSLSLLKEIYVEEGCHDDWMELHALHYKAENLGIWPRYFRCKLGDQLIGVGVMTVPRMNLAGRNDYFVHMKPNEHGRDSRLINRHRAVWLNKYSCTNSRLVLDTMYRGVGIAYRMQNIMMRMSRYKVIEFQSSMSRFNPFAQKAGIVFTPPKRSTNYESGLKWFRRWFESVPSDFVGVFEEFNALPPKQYEKCLEEMRTFYFKHSSMEKMGDNRMKGRDRVDALAPAKLLKNLQQLVFAFPLYGVYINPDADRTDLPERIPISAFDRHRLDEPLDLNILAELSKGVC